MPHQMVTSPTTKLRGKCLQHVSTCAGKKSLKGPWPFSVPVSADATSVPRLIERENQATSPRSQRAATAIFLMHPCNRLLPHLSLHRFGKCGHPRSQPSHHPCAQGRRSWWIQCSRRHWRARRAPLQHHRHSLGCPRLPQNHRF